jgi:hypothetical protein
MADPLKKICLVSTGHLSTNPRALKAADALAAAGFDVRVVTINYDPSKWRVDQALMASRRWVYQGVKVPAQGFSRGLWLRSALRQKLYLNCGILRRRPRGPELALSRYLPQLTRLAGTEPADLFIAHSVQAMPATVAAARQWQAKAGVDFEDIFSGMKSFTAPQTWHDEVAAAVEKKYISEWDYMTAASPGVAAAVAKRYGCPLPVVVLNVFPLAERPAMPPARDRPGPLRLYWFSQTIGGDRGLTDAIRAMGMLPAGSVELHLRGSCAADVQYLLRRLLDENKVSSQALVFHPLASPEQMIALAAEFDVGLGLEEPVSENRIICMTDLCTNKVFTYLLAGLALAATSEKDSHEVYDGAGFVYPHGQPEKLAAGLRRWQENPAALRAAKAKAWQLGETRYNWDSEKIKLVAAVKQTLN